MITIGIDPGLTGGVAYLAPELELTTIMPVQGSDIDVHALRHFLLNNPHDLVIVEAQQSMPKQGVASTFRTGTNYGMILGLLLTLQTSFRIVKAQEWKRVVLAGTAKDKDAAIQYVTRRYPSIDLTWGKRTKPHDGIADATCIAEYGRLTG